MPSANEVSEDLKKLMQASSKELIKMMNSEEATGSNQSVEELYQFVKPYCTISALGDNYYETTRKDYNDTMDVWDKLQTRMEGLKGNLEVLEQVMNASVGNIKKELFQQYYETQRDLSFCFGQESALILRRSASAVLFQDAISKRAN